jgi:hypothetical protein
MVSQPIDGEPRQSSPPSVATCVQGPTSDTDRSRRCVERLEHLGIQPGTSLRRLMGALRKQEGRGIKITQRGSHGRLLHMPAEVSAFVDRAPYRRNILIVLAENPRRSVRGKRLLLHELSHLIVRPHHQLNLASHLLPTAGQGLLDPTNSGIQQFRCSVDDEEEREVELTAGLLQHYMAPWVQQKELPPVSGLGLVLARRGTSHESPS